MARVATPLLLLPLLLIAGCLSAASALGATRVVCYFDGAALKRPDNSRMFLVEIEPSLSYCTHLIFGYATINTDTYKVEPPHADDSHTYDNVVELKRRYPGLTVLLSVGGGSADSDKRDKLFELLESDQHRTTFVKSARDLIQKHRFDGIDIAWEFPKNKANKKRGTFSSIWHKVKETFGYAHSHTDEKADEHRSQFTSLIRELRTSLYSQSTLLTLTVIPYINHTTYYDCQGLSPHVDHLHLLAFDYHTPERSPKVADYPAPLYPAGQRSADLTVDGNVRSFLERGFPSRKIILGMPTFARTWKLTEDSRISGVPPIDADGAGDAGHVASTPGLMAYQVVCMLLPNPGNALSELTLRKVTDPTDRLGSYGFRLPAGKVSGVWVGYEDPDVVRYKTSYAKLKSLGGIAFADLALDDYNGICTGNKFPIVREGTLKLRSR